MNKEFVSYEEALELKQLGFDEPCLGFYNHQGQLILMTQEDENSIQVYKNSYVKLGKQYAVPLHQQAFRWFREKYDLFGCIDLQVCTPSHWFIRVDKIEINDYLYHSEDENIRFNTYEEAELACLRKLIEIVKK